MCLFGDSINFRFKTSTPYRSLLLVPHLTHERDEFLLDPTSFVTHVTTLQSELSQTTPFEQPSGIVPEP